ncbi:sensor domain-containing diguanylate cyclase [Rhodoferax saidenbachensis]|uniref:diguanylate cyclase n=1 Tax=Rhodoferax saidenbachensis TaxID=1484693 RepID=A0A1P8KEX3_9BURK|nr:diguanylate cyclase [Rhodoferax saidenbachensis]APW44511.1 sensor domain-containing diguanylate cyclase [Rhodoferax saidenbachensis]
MRRWLCGGLLWLLPVLAMAQAVPVQQPGAGGRDLIGHLTYLDDTGANLTLEQVQAADRAGRFASPPPAKGALSFGFTRSAIWLRVLLHNPGAEPSAQMLEVPNALISQVALFAPDARGAYHATYTGGDLPFATRPYPNRQLVFPLEVPAQSEQVLYLRVQSTIGLLVPVELWNSNDFVEHTRDDYAVQAVYFGMAAAMVLFNLMLFIALRDRIYLLYVSFVLCSAFVLARKGGLAGEFLWPDTLVWSNTSYYGGASLALIAFLMFTRRMLYTATLLPRVDRVLVVLALLHLVAVVGYGVKIETVSRYALVLFLVTAVVSMSVGFWGVYKKMRSAYFYMGAFAMLLLGGVTTVARTMGWLPSNTLTVDGLQLGSSLEMLLLAFALADRFNQMRRDKLKAQGELMTTQQQLLDSVQASERTLALRVEERTQQLQALNDKLEALSMVDGLTGIANRRQFDQVLQKEWTRMQRLGQPLALVMVDVDWFKQYNDQYGHQAGDECLRAIAQAILGISRASDLVARYGGEEFVMIAPATDRADALRMAQRACDAVQALALPHTYAEMGVVTLSCGVATVVPQQQHTPEALLRSADEALYQAKAAGRNQAVLAPAEPGGPDDSPESP